MPRIFISYRRADTKATAGRIYDRLQAALARENLFMDVDDIPPGVDFRAYLQHEISQADIVLIIIGTKWASILHERRDDPNDFVRIELESALEQRKFTIPVLVEGASMPSVDDLPPHLQDEFPYLNAAIVGDNPDFNHDMNRLLTNLQNMERLRQTKSRFFVGAGFLVILVIVIIGLLASQSQNPNPSANETQVGQASDGTSTVPPTINTHRTSVGAETPGVMLPTMHISTLDILDESNSTITPVLASVQSNATMEATLPPTSTKEISAECQIYADHSNVYITNSIRYSRTQLFPLPLGKRFSVIGVGVTEDGDIWWNLDPEETTALSEWWVRIFDVLESGPCDKWIDSIGIPEGQDSVSVTNMNVAIRNGPGTEYPIVDTAHPGEVFSTSGWTMGSGQNAGFIRWYRIQLSEDAYGWISGTNIVVSPMITPLPRWND